MSNVVPFKPRAPERTDIDGVYLDCRKWECGGCEGNTFHLWCDGVVACATCDALTVGMKATLEIPK